MSTSPSVPPADDRRNDSGPSSSSSSSSFSSSPLLSSAVSHISVVASDPSIALPLLSVPFFLGGYIGYRRALTNEEFMSTWTARGSPPSRLSSGSSPMSSPARPPHRPGFPSSSSSPLPFSPARHAAQALLFGTLLCVGGVGLLLGGACRIAGVSTVGEAVEGLRGFGGRVRGGLERAIGKDPTAPRTEEERREREEVAKMTYNEEAEYFENKIFGTGAKATDKNAIDTRTRNPEKVKCGGVGSLP